MRRHRFGAAQAVIVRRGMPFRTRRRRAVMGLALGAVTSLNAGCYHYVPLRGDAPPTGERVALFVSDEGRVALRNQFGPEIDRIEGVLLENGGEQFLMSVTRVKTIRGETSHWTGERAHVPRKAVENLQVQRFSRGRTIMAVGTAAVVAVAFIATRSLLGFGTTSEPPPGGPPPDQ